MKTLLDLYKSHTGKVSDKWALYLREYDRLFAPYREQAISILEIGIQNGGSLEIWSQYFPNAQKFVGCDINPDCANLTYADPRIAVIVGDATTLETQAQVLKLSASFDLIIEDGSHTSSDIVKAFARYFPALKTGGLFVAEDLHCSYWEDFEGGIFHPYSSITFFKHLADMVNHEHWGVEKSRTELIAGFKQVLNVDFDETVLAEISSIEFLNSICVVRKKENTENVLGLRVVAGVDAEVMPVILSLANSNSAPIPQIENQWSSIFRPPAESYQDQNHEITMGKELLAQQRAVVDHMRNEVQAKQAEVEQLRSDVASLSQAVTERDGQIASLSQAVTERDGQIAKICSSHSWRLTHPLRATRLVVIRVKSGLKNYLRSFWRMLPLSSKQKADLKAAVFRYSPITIKLQEGLSEASTDATLTISSTGVSNPYADDYRARFSFAFNRHGNDFVPLTEECVEAERLKVKVIAFYLPQFHPVPENDKNWGLGFTEWTNVSKATPQFVGHYQPRLPGELGFYDLRLKEIQRRQIELARQHGIHGFCYHHYWFNGKKILDEPFQQVLNDTTLDLPFCLCWANENWTRRWDGGDHEIILAQKHSPEDDLAFFADILPALKDQRYIRIDDKPLLIVYRPGLLPDAAATALRWRHAAAEAGLPGLFIASAATFGFDDYESIGYDGLVQFPPHNVSASDVTNRQTLLNESFSGHVYDYSEYAENALKAIAGKTHTFPCVMMNWDNEARKPGKGHVFLGGTPKNYKSWLRRCFDFVLSNNTEGERLVFVNAWNEWAEGTYLEPDRRYGYAYLHATRDVLRHYYSPVKSDDFIVSNNARFMRRGKVALVVHLYYFDLFDELFSLISGTDELDVFITVPVHFSVDQLNKIVGTLTNVYLVRVENRGRDILPFLTIFPIVSSFGYDYLVKVHSKKSPQRSDGVLLRQHAWKELLIPENVVRIIRAFSADTTLGLISPNNSICSLSNNDYLINNSKHLKFCLERLGFGGEPLTFEFIAGSMFWARVSALKNLTNLELDKGEFEEELGQLDGTMAHAIERLLCFLSERNGYNTLSMEQLSKVNPTADGFPA